MSACIHGWRVLARLRARQTGGTACVRPQATGGAGATTLVACLLARFLIMANVKNNKARCNYYRLIASSWASKEAAHAFFSRVASTTLLERLPTYHGWPWNLVDHARDATQNSHAHGRHVRWGGKNKKRKASKKAFDMSNAERRKTNPCRRKAAKNRAHDARQLDGQLTRPWCAVALRAGAGRESRPDLGLIFHRVNSGTAAPHDSAEQTFSSKTSTQKGRPDGTNVARPVSTLPIFC